MASAAQRKPLGLRISLTIFLVLWFIIAAFPFFWTFWGSFKVELDFFSIADWTNAIFGRNTQETYGRSFTGAGYYGAWVTEEFWRNALNTSITCLFVVVTSLTIGTLGAYALSRSSYNYVFWLLIVALMFRAMPPITLVSGYLPPFFQYNVWGYLPTGIIVLVAMNQPFTLWMLHSFFESIPKELDESAKVDGCTQFQAFRNVIIPVMWPGVITTGLFSFLLAYNDFAVGAMILAENNRTMVAQIAAFLGTTYTEGNVMFAVSAVVSATVPLFILVMFFQRQIVSGLTAGAVKG
ncbi:MAG: carbohydrate ABC transporter permease [Pseudomonadota bacterium]